VNKKMAAAFLAAALLGGIARAEDPKPAPSARESVMTFLRNLKLSLAQSAVSGERKRQRTAAVAAVRGASQSSELANPDEPALKGDEQAAKNKQLQAENAEFEKALDLVLNGKSEEGVKALEAFVAKHPKSHDLASAEQAIQKTKELLADKPAADKPAAAGGASQGSAPPAKN
jgi:chemotaxis response regulator CheB